MGPVRVLAAGGRGPAAARNAGWRAASTPWVVFLDDDVVPAPGWPAAVAGDLAGLPADVAGSQGRIRVPPPDRRLTDSELATAALSSARWITADMAYRRSALAEADGFDETFRRAYREDTDLALRVLDRGYRLVRGDRLTVHPLRGGGVWGSVAAQRGNADDVVMRRRHGARWRRRVGEARGRFRVHLATTAALALSGA
ncbi:glycosyltransferase family 2 protein, partial [Allosalinactinospora lopnorensis]|uniref:glycosyltransferase family 2 protein n=1 Tax=Allosalinactinospora lopnorensis TaxID=1352348 RepID=UPI001F4551B2